MSDDATPGACSIGISRLLTRVVPPGELSRGYAETEQKQQPEILCGSSHPALAFPPARRDCNRVIGMKHVTQAPEPAHEIDIFHQRPLPKSAEALERLATHEQALIAIRKTKPPDSPCHAAFDHASLPGGRFHDETEVAAYRASVLRFGEHVQPSCRRTGVRVQEDEPLSARPHAADIHLDPAALATAAPGNVRKLPLYGRKLRIGTRIHHDDLD